MKAVAIICARGGSKGLTKKNLKELDSESLIARVIRQTKEAKCVDNIVVTTDAEDIAQVAKEAGAEIPFMRPKSLAQDLSTTEETLQHALINYEEIKNIKYDIGVFLTATDIFRKVSWIKQAVTILKERPEIESVFVGHRTHKNFWEKGDDGTWVRLRDWMSVYSSRQIRRIVVREDTGLACASRAWLWREGRRIGDRVEIIENDDDFTSIDIHTEEDLMLAQEALNIRRLGKYNDK